MPAFNKSLISGRVGSKPELRHTPNGVPVTSFSVCRQPRHLNKQTNTWEDGDATWYEVEVYNRLAENVAASLDKGFEVTVIGEVKLHAFTHNGVQNKKLKLTADDVTISLDHQVVQVVDKSAYGSSARSGSNTGTYSAPASTGAPAQSSSNAGADEPPF